MGCPVFDTACPTIPQLDSPKSSGFVCHLENVSSMYQTKLDWCFNQFQDALFCSLSAFGCVLVALRLEHRQRVGFPFYLPSYIDDSWWFPFVYPLLFESGNIHISYGCFPFDYYPFRFGSCIPFVPLPLPKTTWSCPSTYIYSGTWQTIPKPCQSLPTILRSVYVHLNTIKVPSCNYKWRN